MPNDDVACPCCGCECRAAATREQAALLRECRAVLSTARIGHYRVKGSDLCACGQRMPCWEARDIDAILSRLPASDSGNEEKPKILNPDAACGCAEYWPGKGHPPDCPKMRAPEEPQRVLVLGHWPMMNGSACEALVEILPPTLSSSSLKRCGETLEAHYAPSPTPDTARGRE